MAARSQLRAKSRARGGFYLLGRLLYRERLWALVLAGVTLSSFDLNLGEFWGIEYEAIPRVSFQAFLPYVLALLFKWRDSPSKWPWLMILLSMLIYVHPVSAPGVAFAVWFALGTICPAGWSRLRRAGYMTLLGAIFIIGCIPFLANYMDSHQHGVTANYQELYSIFELRMHEFLNLPTAIGKFFITLTQQYIFPLAIVAIIALLLNQSRDREATKLLFALVLGVLFVSTVVPIVDQRVSAGLQALPVELDLVRGLRYLVPLFELIVVSAIAAAGQGFISRAAIFARVAAGLALILIFHPPSIYAARTFESWSRLQLAPEPSDAGRFAIRKLNAIKSAVPPGNTLVVQGGIDPLVVRSAGHRPVAFTEKDGGALAYGNLEQLRLWYSIRQEWQALPQGQSGISQLAEFARRYHVRYFVTDYAIDFEAAAQNGITVVHYDQYPAPYSMRRFSIARVDP